MGFDAEKAVKATVGWIRDWFEVNGPGCNAIVGISGGKDSSIAAALCAERIAPGVREYMIASLSGREKGLDAVLNVLRLRPLISGNMALGEGTGAVMLFPLLDLALGFLETGSTFAEIDVAEYERFGKCSF